MRSNDSASLTAGSALFDLHLRATLGFGSFGPSQMLLTRSVERHPNSERIDKGPNATDAAANSLRNEGALRKRATQAGEPNSTPTWQRRPRESNVDVPLRQASPPHSRDGSNPPDSGAKVPAATPDESESGREMEPRRERSEAPEAVTPAITALASPAVYVAAEATVEVSALDQTGVSAEIHAAEAASSMLAGDSPLLPETDALLEASPAPPFPAPTASDGDLAADNAAGRATRASSSADATSSFADGQFATPSTSDTPTSEPNFALTNSARSFNTAVTQTNNEPTSFEASSAADQQLPQQLENTAIDGLIPLPNEEITSSKPGPSTAAPPSGAPLNERAAATEATVPVGPAATNQLPKATTAVDGSQSELVRTTTTPGSADDTTASGGSEAAGDTETHVTFAAGSGSTTSAGATTDKPAASRQPVSEQVAVQIVRAVRDGISRLHVTLEPNSLGRLDISLEIHRDGRVSAIITAENPQTLDALRGEAKALTQSLNNAGLKADQNSISFGFRASSDGSTSNYPGGHSQGYPATAASAASDRGDAVASDSSDLQIPASPPRRGTYRGHLDIRA
jgi:Flagellar hook-length control protein FliK.